MTQAQMVHRGLSHAQRAAPALQAPAQMRPVGAQAAINLNRPQDAFFKNQVVHSRSNGVFSLRITLGWSRRQAKMLVDREAPEPQVAPARRSQRHRRIHSSFCRL